MQKFSVTLVEDDADVRARLSDLIIEHEQFELLDACGTVAQGLSALLKHRPDVLLTDIGLPDGSGIDIIKAIEQQHLDCDAMVISGFQDENLVFRALEAGAKSYILKHDKSQKITDAILAMINGGAPMSPVIARLMLLKFHHAEAQTNPLPEALTPRQIKILKLLSQGFSSQEVSEKLGITYYTVTTHIKNIYNKLQVNSRSEAIYQAIKQGLLS
ncbi:MAG: response regulator transcription factor [Gammaproteobacteria bacterium]|nr:response regulator transcription factor [Gammaproteobacteria bacterium]